MNCDDDNSGRSTSGDEYVPSVESTTRSTTNVKQSNNSNSKNSSAAAEQRKKRRKSGEVVRAFACQLCTKRYGTRAALSLHFKLKHELPLPLTSWNELQAARDVELAYGPMINDTVEAFVADKHGEMSQRAVVRTAALACILGRSSSPTGADAETIGQANSGGNKDKNNNNNNNNNNNSSKKESAVRRAPPRTSARKRVRITIPSDIDDEHDDMLTVTPEERISPTIPDVSHELTTPPHKAISLPSLADVLGHDRSSAALLSSTTASSFSKNFNADFLSLPSLHSLPAFRAQTATATVQVDVEIFKMPPALLAPQSTSETFSPAPKRRDSVAAVEETALLLVTLGGANKIALLHSH